jgi:hypothetical protein
LYLVLSTLLYYYSILLFFFIFIMFFFFRKTIDRFIFKLLSLPSLSQKNISEYVLKFPVFYEQ